MSSALFAPPPILLSLTVNRKFKVRATPGNSSTGICAPEVVVNPAKIVFILGKYRIGDVDGATNTSALKGTLLAKDITDAQTKYLVFGKNKATGTEVGFYEPTTTTIPANRAFFMDTTGSSIALNFGNVTAINNVATDNANANAPIFDLSGRRVVKAVKGGIYIQNGKKFVK